jgi:hypothetical protein
VKIPLKIPLDRFLILKNLKYMLSWMGKWEIRCYFEPAALIVTPVMNYASNIIIVGYLLIIIELKRNLHN